MARIAAEEGLSANAATLKELAAQANQDIRLVLGQLQMWRLGRAAMRCVRVCVLGGVLVGDGRRGADVWRELW